MSAPDTNRIARERGFSLAEILVAMAVFTAVILAALMLYDRSNKVFKQSVEASDMQQSTRVAFDRLVADLRMTGFDYDRDGTPFGALSADWAANTTYTLGMLVQPKANPNGHTYICITGGVTGASEPVWPTGANETVNDGTVVWQEDGDLQYQQPDEQIEYAGEHAVAIRANFNFDTATGPCPTNDLSVPCENGRERQLESTPFPVVTTSNNEIIIYALKPVKWASGQTADTLSFFADVAIPRNANPYTDGKEAEVTIGGIDLCTDGCLSPPYTLMRYTVENDGTADDGTPVADNIRNMTFRYFKTTAAADADLISTYPNGAGKYDGAAPNAVIAERDSRGKIRAIELTLVGMNSQRDGKYTDATDTVAPNYRKLELKALIVPRNIARRGMKEYSTDAPGKPTLKSVCAGACNSVFATWVAPTTGGDIDSFAVLYDTDPCQAGGVMPAGGFQYSEEVGLNLSGDVGRYMEPGKDWYFAVQAINKWGAQASDCFGPVNVINTTRPAALNALAATHPDNADPDLAAQENQVSLFFPIASANVAGEDQLSCVGGGGLTQGVMPPPEKRYYEIIRSVDDPDFQPTDAGVVTLLDAGSAVQPTDLGGSLRFIDTTAANCTDYYYRIRVVDYCARNDAWNDSGNKSQAISDWFPALDQDGVPGRAVNDVKPKAPTLSLKDKVCAGASNECTLTLQWNAVNLNVEEKSISVRQYILRGYLWNDEKDAYNTEADEVVTITDGSLTAEVKTGATDQWKYEVVALDCVESDPSVPFIFPCEFKGGDLNAAITAGGYSGTGTSDDPVVVEAPTLTVTTDNEVSEISASVYYVSSGQQAGATMTQTGTIKTASFALPQTDDGQIARVLVIARDSAGCTKNADVYIVDQKAPTCTLTDTGSNSSLVTLGTKTVTFKLENTSDDALTLLSVTANYTVTNQMKGLTSVSFNGGAEVTASCTSNTAKVTPATTQTIPADSSTYTVRLTMDTGNLQGSNPINSLCVTYRAVTGDIVSCQMHPHADSCDPAAAACQ